MTRYITPAICIALLIAVMAGNSYGQDKGCTFKVAPTTIHFFDIRDTTAEIRVIASAPTCRFTATTRYLWITLTVEQEGGAGRIVVKVDSNDSMTHRVGSLSVEGEEVTVIQAGPRRGGGQGS
jgi:hypothetical protein